MKIGPTLLMLPALLIGGCATSRSPPPCPVCPPPPVVLTPPAECQATSPAPAQFQPPTNLPADPLARIGAVATAALDFIDRDRVSDLERHALAGRCAAFVKTQHEELRR
jgi:hypothetical protein